MKKQIRTTLILTLDDATMSSFVPLLQKGVQVKAQLGRSMKHLLCEQYGVNPEYLTERIQTIFLDGKVVDNVETTTVKGGAIIALSAAMPGLAGATLRTGGLLAAFRDGLTHEEDLEAVDSHELGMVTVKLFNLLVRELGPVLLEKGVWVTREDAESLVKRWADTPLRAIDHVEMDGLKVSLEELAGLDWSGDSEYLLLRAVG
ncbi:hypothetical protein [Desulfoluna limicola]|nr:hypothetical protein [Desulfoluna limicola]